MRTAGLPRPASTFARALACVAAFLSLALGATAPLPAEPASAGQAGASLESLAWLPGTWRGTAGGQSIEEIWTVPAGGALAGMFRWYSDDSVRLYELMTIDAAGGGLTLRLRHFSAALEAWEEKDAPLVFRLAAADDRSVRFVTTEEDGTITTLVYTLEPAGGDAGAAGERGLRDRLTIRLLKRPPGGEERRTDFRFERH
ncbi:MAG: DUF6265 family protein [Holophagales bacterium]|nr:DUF6265 family protein [Holophagales bacterium]